MTVNSFGRSRRRRAADLPAVLALAVVLALVTACGVGMGSKVKMDKGDTLTVGVIPVADFAGVYIAQDRGFFADEGLKVETKVMQNAAAIAPSVINGQLQFGTAATPPLVSAVEKGLPLELVANAASVTADPDLDPSALVVSPGSDVRRPRDLEGRTVAVNALNSIVHVAAAAVIRADGGDPARVHFIPMPFPDMITALGRHAVDAASVVEPFQLQSVAAGATVIAHPYSAMIPGGGTYSVVFTAGPFAETNPELVKAFVRAVNRADLVAAKDPAAVGAVLEKYGKLPPQVFAKMRLPVYTDQISADALQGTADLMNHLGFTSKPVDTKEMIWP
ncbi:MULTISPECIES: ABC transporter substrate-binding protein [Gordonia]|uniref:MetQ/NlpA family ABC transporter substrate-binding protein n=1 Tax=Gordonia cholesterolivorans TaxID=559625 RepID=A0ABN3HAS0_9ACTN|nr:ABC transporter substrate-binding protein [Gordonia sihwensis]MBY4569684.1 hypothetical protein [Gordonia sihwensis]